MAIAAFTMVWIFAFTIAGMRTLRPIAIEPHNLDSDPFLLNVENGTIDLRTGDLRAPDPHDLLSKRAPVSFNAAAEAPTWRKFLLRVLPDCEVRSYVQRAAGYSLTGDVTEQCLFFCHGGGANGKSTFLETLRDLLGEGEYAKAAQPDLLLGRVQERHPVELADLRGMRFVSTVEAGEGRSWDEVRVKWLTGGDTISARFLYGQPFSFVPTHKFWLAANHRPRVNGTDLGFWRRVHLIPWTVTIPDRERDRELRTRMRAELPGILRWAIEGAVEWHRTRLRPPPAVLAATQAYRAGEDVIGAFLEECTVPGRRVIGSALYEEFRRWVERSGERPLTARAFGDALEERGIARSRSNGQRWFVGVALKGGDPSDAQ